MGVSNQHKIKRAVEQKLIGLLKNKNDESPKKEDLTVLGYGIKYLAVSAKLEESEFGKELMDLEQEQEGGDTNEPTDDL